MATFYRESQCDRSLLDGKTIAVVGYGSQGRAHALNLRDNGSTVVVGLRERSESRARATADGVEVASISDSVREADVVSLLIPDEVHRETFEEDVAPSMKRGAALCLAHGLSIHFGLLTPGTDIDVFMVAPLGGGSLFRELFLEARGLPAYVAVHQDISGKALGLALAYASRVGCARAGLFETTFQEEAEVDLFGEQAILCGGLSFLLLRAFETLVEKGYEPEIAYLECVNQLKATVDLMSLHGVDGFTDVISSPALYGMLTRGPELLGGETKRRMGKLLDDIRTGHFVNEWKREGTRDSEKVSKLMREWKSLAMHDVGRTIRKKISP